MQRTWDLHGLYRKTSLQALAPFTTMARTTPEFVQWAVELPCPLRDIEGWTTPEKTESHLRAIRAARHAQVEGRTLEGICVQPLDERQPASIETVKAFQIAEVFQVFGGEGEVAAHCGHCTANALLDKDPGAMAGCFGWLPVSNRDHPEDDSDLRDLVEAVAGNIKELDHHFPGTSPRWYGLWLKPVLENQPLAVLEQLFSSIAAELPWPRSDLELMLSAVRRCREFQLRLHIDLVPAGNVDGIHWSIDVHCKQCHASWINGQQVCHVCGCDRRPDPVRQRLARGDRPYWHLYRFLGKKKGAEFLQRYRVHMGKDDVQSRKRAGQDRCHETG